MPSHFFIPLVAIVFLFACNSRESELPACEYARERAILCEEEPVDCMQSNPQICTYGDIVVETEECNCSDIIYQAICDAGVTASVETIQNGLVCEITESGD